MTRLILATLMAVMIVTPQIRAQQSSPALEKLFASAQHKATVDGDLKGAIDDYKRIVSTAGKDRGAAARALLRMAEAYQKLGDSEAQQVYRRIVNEFADQKDASGFAAARLRSEGARTAGRADDAPVNRSAWKPPSPTAPATLLLPRRWRPDSTLTSHRSHS